jgi:glutathione S-transferase
MIHFYGSPMSSAGRTQWMLEELEVPYEYHRVSTRDGGTRTPEFLAVNPGGKVPAIIDGHIHLAESAAINFYLAEKHRPDLMGADLGERALVYQWSFWALTNLQPEVLTVMTHTSLLPEGSRSPQAAETARRNTVPLLRLLDIALTGNEFLVGERFTVADVNAGSVVNIARAIGLLEEYRHALAWMDRLRARPAYLRAADKA